MSDRNLLLQEGDILDPKTCEVDGVEYSLVEAKQDIGCLGCVARYNYSFCERLDGCSNGYKNKVWIKKESK